MSRHPPGASGRSYAGGSRRAAIVPHRCAGCSVPEAPANMAAVSELLFHLVCERTPSRSLEHHPSTLTGGLAEAQRFISRFDGHLAVRHRTILELGCGYGPLT